MKINHVIKTLVVSDFLVNSGFSLFAPIFAVFITKQVQGGSLEVVGFAAALTQIFKSVVQVPVARILDKNHGEFDDFYSMIFGSLLMACIPFLYLLVREPVHIYIIQSIYGVGLAFCIPPWYAIFSRHLDKMQENIEWSMESVGIGISGALAAAIGGVLAQKVGFNYVFIIAGIIAIFGAAQQIRIFKDLKKKVSQGQVRPDGK